MKISEVPVMDRRNVSLSGIEAQSEWRPPRVTLKVRGVHVACPGDRPRYTIDEFISRGNAWYSSNRCSGQAVNDNKDWPLGKLLKTEGLDYQMRLAERYRDLHETATSNIVLAGREPNDLYVVENVGKDGKRKGVKRITGKRAQIDTAPMRKVSTSDSVKKLAAPVPKKWQGDWPLLAKIDANRELAVLRGKLGYVPTILDAFEWAVVDNLTLAEIGNRLGAGSKGGKGEARARIFDGFDIIDRFWRRRGPHAA